MRVLIVIAMLLTLTPAITAKPRRVHHRHHLQHPRAHHRLTQREFNRLVYQQGAVAPPATNICEDLERCVHGDRIPTNGCRCPEGKELRTRILQAGHPKASELLKPAQTPEP